MVCTFYALRPYGSTSDGVGMRPRELLHYNLELFLQHYVAGVANIVATLVSENAAAAEQFMRQRHARYVQAGRWASHMFAYQDPAFEVPGEVVFSPPVEGVFQSVWLRNGLSTFDDEQRQYEGENVETEDRRNVLR